MEQNNRPELDIEKAKEEALLKPLESAEELQNWIELYLDLKFPMGTVHPESTHGPIDAMWEIYQLMKTGRSAECPQVTMLASRDSFKCQSKGSKLLTPKGLVNIEDIKVGDVVWSGWNWEKVTYWVDDGTKESYGFTLSNGIDISGSPVHRYWCLRDGKEQWIQSQDIEDTDLFCINTNTGFAGINLNSNKEEYDIGYFLGLLAGDSSTTHIDKNNSKSFFSITTVDPYIKDFFYNFVDSVLKSNVSIGTDEITYKVHTKNSIEQLFKWGVKPEYCFQKTIPSFCNKSHSAMIGFINGLFDTDGSFSSKNQIEIPITAKDIALNLQKVLISYGIDARVISNKKLYKQKKCKQNHLIHKLYINANEAHKLFQIGFKNSSKKTQKWRSPLICNTHDSIPIYHVSDFIKHCMDNRFIIKNRNFLKPKIYSSKNSGSVAYKGISCDKLHKLLSWYKENVDSGFTHKDSSFFINKITSILENKWFPFVKKKRDFDHFYDITITNDHSYWSNGTISHNTLGAASLEVLCMLHFRLPIAHMAAIKAQSAKAIQYVNSFFRKLRPYLEANGWKKSSDSKTYIEWITDLNETVYLNIISCTIAGANCVVGKEWIATKDGVVRASKLYKMIQQGIPVSVKTFNISTGEIEYKTILNSFKTQKKKKYIIHTGNGKIECSGEHKLYIKNRGWLEAKELKEGDVVLYDQGNSLNYEDVKYKCEEMGFELLDCEYTNNSTPMLVKCPKGHISNKKFQEIQIGKRCLECRKIETKTILNKFKELGYRVLTNPNNISSTKQKLSVICCNNHTTELCYHDINSKNNGCMTCSIDSRRLSTEFVKQVFLDKGYTPLFEKYFRQTQKLKTKCPNGHIYETNFSNFYYHDKRCSLCNIGSRAQQEIYDFVQSIYTGDIKVNDRTIIKPLEIDIYMPDRNFGIEFDGLYWHSTKVKLDIKEVNKKKAAMVKEIGLNLLCIFEDEWTDEKKRVLIKEMIKYRLGTGSQKKLRASKLEIRRLNKNKDFSEFFNTYHLDGTTSASFAYGLFHGDEMVSCMSFRRSFTDKCYEIARFASNFNYLVHGGGSKIIKNAMELEHIDKLITFSNNRLSLGNVYQKSGFKEITKTTDPSYYYTDYSVRIWRYKCRRINEPSIIAEYPSELAQAEGGVFSRKYLGHSKPLYRIYDYGHRKWLLEKL
jgi:intein/homing endonuclease